jgi:dipeptidyl aminopeptidase/acylaminoacyl peptidase
MDDPYANVSGKVKAVVSNYGIFDMVQQWNHDVLTRPKDNIVEKYLGGAPMDNRKLYFDASPMSYVQTDNNSVAFLLAHGTEDDIVDRVQSDAFLLALKQARNPAFHYIAPGAAHGWNSEPIDEPGSYTNAYAPRVLRFLQSRL